MYSAYLSDTILFCSAAAAGAINSVAGGGTLLTFPVLVWVGRTVWPGQFELRANVTSTLALWPGSLGSIWGYRREIEQSRAWMTALAAPSFAGGTLGAILLVKTPASTFAALVPFLILFATGLFAVQGPIVRILRERRPEGPPSRAWWGGAVAFQFAIALYGGYFGAGIGILMLSALGLLGLTDIHQMNGLKTVLAVCINGLAALCFAFSGMVDWRIALLMALGAILGGYTGAGLARRLGQKTVRLIVIAIGLSMAFSLMVKTK